MLTRHGDEICEEFFNVNWDDYREIIECIDVTPVAQFFVDNRENFSDTRKDFGCVRPPWSNTWAEYVWPSDPEVGHDSYVDRIGADIERLDMDDMEAFRGELTASEEEFILENPEVDAAYSAIFNASLGRQKWVDEGIVVFFCDENGQLVSDPQRRVYPIPGDTFAECVGDKEEARIKLVQRLIPVLLGFGFAHCPNVKIWEDEKAEAVREKRKKSGKNPGQTFKCLEIEPLKEEMRREAKGDGSEVDRREHTVRGHFRHYTEDAPLFGHYTGNVWVPAHKRGSKEHGTVEKEYRSKPPEGRE